jgi:hypothetical protein
VGLLAVRLGAEAWLVVKAIAVLVPVVAAVVFSIVAVMWSINVGEIGIHQNAAFQSKFFFWHGVSVVLCMVLAAAGSFIMLFGFLVRGLLSGAA